MNALAAFALLTVKSPRDAAHQILAQDWPREALWTGFLLSVVLNTCVYTLQQVLFPLPPEVLIPRFAPGAYFAVILLLQISFIAMLATTGRWLGGQGNLAGLLALVTWLQLLQAGLNAAVVAMLLVMPALAALLNIAANIMVFFILLHFVNAAHKFGSVWRSLGVVMMASMILVFALLFIVGLIGPANLGLPENV
ncbi:YIP1 family protein [Leisingera sp. M527]|uniref:YIP1 family protein n=1 Tax=unclassified Leisingera TaxID=2614906 RepID=UPI0021A51C6F|nr:MULTISPECIES: YIP1 family protein [unclassified Leisingera]UWQ30597.1 YIP1 family protein [Leisingera sp. M523]UWQ34740.1 YIP1 family protein [Leisingera sp. M527]